MDEAAINEAINQQLLGRLTTPEGLATFGWYQELDDAEQAMVRRALYAALPTYGGETLEATMIKLISLVSGYELMLAAYSLAAQEAPHAE